MGRSLDGAEVGLLRAHTLGNKRPRQIRPGSEFERLFAVGNEEAWAAGTIAALPVTVPVMAFKLAASGLVCPVGHAVRNPSS